MDYSTIVSSALALTDRADASTSALMPTFMAMVESRINRKTLTDSTTSDTTFTLSVGQDTYTLPSTYSSIRDVQLLDVSNGTPYVSMAYLAPSAFNLRRSIGDDGGYYYTILQDKLIIYPAQDTPTTMKVYYFDSISPLSSTNTTNYLSLNYPDIYIFGLLVELSGYAKDYEAAHWWDERFKAALMEWQAQDEMGRWSGQNLQPRAM